VQREQERMEDQAEEVDALSSEGAVARKRPRALKHESLSGFHMRVTSEDNAEFEHNQEMERRQREIHLGIIYSSAADKKGRLAIEAAVNGKVVENETNDRALLGCDTPLGLASDLYNASPSAGLRITNKEQKDTAGIGRNGLFFQPQHRDGNAMTQDGHLLLESSAANSTGTFLTLTSGKSTADNLLMPPPPARKSDILKYQLVEYQPKPLVPHIHPPATRFHNQLESRLLTTSNITRHRTRHSVDGQTSDATTDLDEVPPSLENERAARREAAIREQNTFVPMTPLIQPGAGRATVSGDLEDAPIMTWGTVASTPLVLGNGLAVDKTNDIGAHWEPTKPNGNGANHNRKDGIDFDVLEENDRERLAHRAEKKLNDRTKKYKSAGSNALLDKSARAPDFDDASVGSGVNSVATTATTSYDRSASLTPAARALLEANSNAMKATKRSNLKSSSRIFQPSPVSSQVSNAGSRNSFGSALRMSYTASSAPSTMRKKKAGRDNKSSSSSLRRAAEGGTPRIER
jgi:hypothetical protein